MSSEAPPSSSGGVPVVGPAGSNGSGGKGSKSANSSKKSSGGGAGGAMGSGVFWALMYGLSSMTITLFNKAVMSTYDFQYPMFLTVCQSLFTLVALTVVSQMGIITLPPFNWELAKKIAPLSLAFVGYVVVSLMALGSVNVPMFTALRRTTICFAMGMEYYYYGKTPSQKVLIAVAIMLVGAGIAAWKDLTFDLYSYGLVILTNVLTALYTTSIGDVKKQSNLSTFAILYYNTVLTLPVLFIVCAGTGEMSKALAFPNLANGGFMVVFFFSATLAFFLNLSTYFSSSLNGATTQSVIGQVKNFAAFILSLFLFSDYIFEPTNFTGLLIGFSGGVYYGFVQYQASQERQRLAKLAEATGVKDGGSIGASVGAGAVAVRGDDGNGGSREEDGGGEGEGAELAKLEGGQRT